MLISYRDIRRAMWLIFTMIWLEPTRGPGVMYGCESWTVKKTEHRRIDAFELWCWRRLLRVPWTARKSNQSILKDISPGCSLEGLMLKLKLQYLGHLMWRAESFEKTLMLGKIEGSRRRWQQGMRWLDAITDSTSFLPMNTQDWSPLEWTGWISLQSKGLSRVFSNNTVQKHKFFGTQLSSQSNSHIHTWPLEKP